MTEFTRHPETEANFEETSMEVLEITIRFKEDEYEDSFDRNTPEGLRFREIKNILNDQTKICYFQRQKEFEGKNRETGQPIKFSNYKITIPFEPERAVEILVGVYLQDGFTFKLNKASHLKVIPFFQAPKKDFRQRNCLLKLRGLTDYSDFRPSEKFKALVNALDSLNLPVVDIYKERDRKIWHDYVAALKKLVKQKEQVWKIKRVTQPYLSAKEGQKERDTFIDIYIDEGDIEKQFENEITTIFKDNELEDYGVGAEKAFVEFKNYREPNEVEQVKLKELGSEYFYDLRPDSISHYLSGEITFRYLEVEKKIDVFRLIKNKLSEDYQLETSISENGEIEMNEEDVKHLQKIISDNFNKLLTIHKDTSNSLKVTFESGTELLNLSKIVKQKLDAEGFTKSVVNVARDNQSITVEVGTYLHPNKFSNDGLNNTETISRYGSDKPIKAKPIDGLEINSNSYQLTNASREDNEEAIRVLAKYFPSVTFYRRPTLYIYKPNKQATSKQLRDFKSETDLKGKTDFNFSNSTLKIIADNAIDYDAQLKRIAKIFPSVTIEKKPFSQTFHLKFLNENEENKNEIWNQVQNKIRTAINSKVEFDLLSNNSKLLFRYYFQTIEQRTGFIQAVITACSEFSELISYSFENVLGRTIYELYKNETLELEKEKEVRRNVRQASFVFLTPEERKRLADKTKEFGANAIFREGIAIGTLFRKDGDKLQFKIKDEFDLLLTANQENRLELSEIAKGFIKPIFPGELVNLDRMIKAMEKVTSPGTKSEFYFDKWGNRLSVGYPVNRNLPNFLFDPNEARPTVIDLEEEKIKILENLNEPLLKNQPKQLEAVVKAITAKDLAMIQGPPGTGKTTVIAEIIWQTLLRDPEAKILITSQTNLAVDNALERLSGKKLVRPIRIGNTEKFENEGKAYSNERIKRWLQFKDNAKQTSENKDNAVADWIDNVIACCSADEKYKTVVEKWKKGLNKKEDVKQTFGDAYFNHVNVFAATCSECGSRTFAETYQNTFNQNLNRTAEMSFDLVIMDEASKATPPELVLPLTFGKKVVIIGDHKQLPPMIDEEEFTEALEAVGALKLIEHWDRDDYKISQFEKLFKNAPKTLVASLDTQFRMHEQIMNCISQFYKDQEELENGLICGIKMQMDIPDFTVKASRWHGIKKVPFIDTMHHAIWVNVETPESKVGTSYENEGEINAIQKILHALKNSEGFETYYNHTAKEEEKEIGIITYYMPQMMRIRKTLYPHLQGPQWRNFDLHKYENEFQLPFRINTVDKFQGMERNIIIISTVRSDKQIQISPNGIRQTINNTTYPKALGFAKELQRVNVGLSRAKRLLIVIGNQNHFSHKREYADAQKMMHCVDIKQLENLFKV